jgi:Capsule polysaccharide biosynthesis protein
MRFLFTTIQFEESRAYGQVTRELVRRGHDVAHVTVSRRSAARLRSDGFHVTCLPDAMREVGDFALEAETARLERTYPIRSLRWVYRSDPVCEGRSEHWCMERTVRHFLALEKAFDAFRPDAVMPEVGSETMRTAATEIGRKRGAAVLFPFYTVFPRPLRLYVNRVHAPIVDSAAVRPLDPDERAEVEAFIESYIARDAPLLPHRKARVTLPKLRDFARHVAVNAVWDRENEYLVPRRFVTNTVKQRARAALATPMYQQPDPARPFVYFPLHVTQDFKVQRVIPHCVDQAYLIEQVADALPQGWDVVLKEHPISIGKNPLSFLRRLTHHPNVRLLPPRTSSHELIQTARAVVVISSTVGLEALLHGRPVLTLGQPFYAGYGVTVDVDSFRKIPNALDEVLAFTPPRDRVLELLHAAMQSTYEGKPALVDPSPENIRRLAGSFESAAARVLQTPATV